MKSPFWTEPRIYFSFGDDKEEVSSYAGQMKSAIDSNPFISQLKLSKILGMSQSALSNFLLQSDFGIPLSRARLICDTFEKYGVPSKDIEPLKQAVDYALVEFGDEMARFEGVLESLPESIPQKKSFIEENLDTFNKAYLARYQKAGIADQGKMISELFEMIQKYKGA